MSIQDFIGKFHALPGLTIGEKKKHLNFLLLQIPDDHDAAISGIQPKDHLESLFRIEILLKLQRTRDLIEMLKCGDEILVIKIIKNANFCRQFAKMLDERCSEGFVDRVLPAMSFVARTRLVRQLEIYGENLDGIFDEILERYGIGAAAKILMGCSSAKIESVLIDNNKNQLALTPYQLKLLFKKHARVFKMYLKFKTKVDMMDEYVLNYIARHDLDLFFETTNNIVRPFIKIGKKVTRRLLLCSNKRELIVQNSQTFKYILHKKTVFKVLQKEGYVRFYLNAFPRTSYDSYKLTDYFYDGGDKQYRKMANINYEILMAGSEKFWGQSLYSFPNIVNVDFLKKLDLEKRQKWVEIKTHTDNNDLLQLLPPSQSIDLIKNKINITSNVYERGNLVNMLVETCKYNNDDLQALLGVEKYVCDRHKNDEILDEFLSTLKNNFQLQNLDDMHWKYLNSLIEYSRIKNNTDYYADTEFHIKYLEYLLNNKKLTDEDILGFLKIQKQSTSSWDFQTNNDELKRILIVKATDLMPQLMGADDRIEEYDTKLLTTIINWNKERGNYEQKIGVFENARLFESFQKIITESRYSYEEYFHYLFIQACKEKPKFDHQKDILLKTLFQTHSDRRPFTASYLYLLKNQPDLFVSNENFEVFAKNITSTYNPKEIRQIIYCVKKHTGLAEKMIDFCTTNLQISSDSYNGTLFMILAVLMRTQEYLKTISQNVSVEKKIDEDVLEESRKIYANTSAAVKSFKFANTSAVLSDLLKFCDGDHLGAALESLYYLFYHCPENDLTDYINVMAVKRVSLRKHAIFLICRTGNTDDVCNLLKRFSETESNISMHKHLFTSTFKYFTVKNSSDTFWTLVKIFMGKLDLENDSESLNLINKLNVIPNGYQVKHVIFVWGLLKEHKKDFSQQRVRLLSSIDVPMCQLLPLDFILEVVNENFLKDVCDDFILLSLQASDYKNEILDSLFSILVNTKHRENFHKIADADSQNARECVSNFVTRLVRRFGDRELINTFTTRWISVFSPIEAIEEFLQLSFITLILDCERDFDKLAERIACIFEDYISKYTPSSVGIFAAVLNTSLKDSFTCYEPDETDQNLFEIYSKLLRNREHSSVVCLLVIELLPNEVSARSKAKPLLYEIVETLRKNPQDEVQVRYNLYLKNVKIRKEL